jgi:hypothetical protein
VVNPPQAVTIQAQPCKELRRPKRKLLKTQKGGIALALAMRAYNTWSVAFQYALRMWPTIRRVLLFSALSCIFSVPPAFSQDNAARIRKEFDTVRTQLKPLVRYENQFSPGGTTSRLLNRRWELFGEWAAAYTSDHPDVAPEVLRAALLELDPDTHIEVVKLADRTYVVSDHRGAVGNVFLLRTGENLSRVVWNIKSAQQTTSEMGRVLDAWSSTAALDDCRERIPTKMWASCGPVFGAIRLLPSSPKGHPRFYVDATYSSEGGSVAAQLSIWEWNGSSLQPLFVKTYGYMIDQGVFTRVDGNLIKVRVKDDWRTFSSCGMCEGRQRDWTLRITPSGVEDLGKLSVVPELDAIDDLFYRAARGMPVPSLVSPSAFNAARKVVKTNQGFGMISDWYVHRNSNSTIVCFSADEIEAQLFTFVPSGQGSRIIDIRPAPITSRESPCLEKAKDTGVQK